MSEEYLFLKEIHMKYVFNPFIMKTLQCSTKHRKYKSTPCYQGVKRAFSLVFQRAFLLISFKKRYTFHSSAGPCPRGDKPSRPLSCPTEGGRKILLGKVKKILDISFKKRWADVKSWSGRKYDAFYVRCTMDDVQHARRRRLAAPMYDVRRTMYDWGNLASEAREAAKL